MLDHDLAKLYGVQTKRLNEQVKRNIDRFPEDFMFQLTSQEKTEVVAKCDHLRNLKYSPQKPYAFTEQGIAMLSSVLNSERAIQVNIQIMRTFIRLRQIMTSNEELRHRIENLEKKYDKRFRMVFKAIQKLLESPEKPRRTIGFHVRDHQRGSSGRRRLSRSQDAAGLVYLEKP